MQTQEKQTLERETRLRYLFLRFKTGLHEVLYNRTKTAVAVGYVVLAFIIWIFRDSIFQLNSGDIFAVIHRGLFALVFPIYSIGGMLLLIVMFGTPFGSNRINDNLWRVGLVNHAGESPLLIKKRKDKERPYITIMEFQSNGIPLAEWEKQQAKVETALNIHIVKIRHGGNKKTIILYTVSGENDLPQAIYWKDEYLSDKSFELILGESLLGRETVNLAQIPHIQLGGSTGSGKSVLLKLLIMQCVKKGATVYLSDFKGGVDFPPVWHKVCRIVTDETALVSTLTSIVNELEERKGLFLKYGCANIDEYSKHIGYTLPRIIFACDEIAEVLDKTGLSKDGKEIVAQIESKLSTIARQGRAFGVHLILATQRPDANILTGQIKTNIDCRICGRADNVLSMIILDNTEAADKIPKDAQGRFLTNDGTVFQGYLFDETKAFVGM